MNPLLAWLLLTLVLMVLLASDEDRLHTSIAIYGVPVTVAAMAGTAAMFTAPIAAVVWAVTR